MSPHERKTASEVLWGHGVEWPLRPRGGRPEAPRPYLPPCRPRPTDESEAALLLYNMGIE